MKVFILISVFFIGLNIKAQIIPGFTYTIMPNGLVNFSCTSTPTTAINYCGWNFGDGLGTINTSMAVEP